MAGIVEGIDDKDHAFTLYRGLRREGSGSTSGRERTHPSRRKFAGRSAALACGAFGDHRPAPFRSPRRGSSCRPLIRSARISSSLAYSTVPAPASCSMRTPPLASATSSHLPRTLSQKALVLSQ